MSAPRPASIVCATARYQVNTRKLKTLVGLICGRLGVGSHQLSVTLTDNRAIRRLNREFRGIDRPTDVLSFPQITWPKPLPVRREPARRPSARPAAKPKPARRLPPAVLGDVVISLPEAARNARGIGQPLDREVCFLLVHGILHLCGHDHGNPVEERRMLAAQRALMRFLAAQSEAPPWTSSVKPRPRLMDT